MGSRRKLHPAENSVVSDLDQSLNEQCTQDATGSSSPYTSTPILEFRSSPVIASKSAQTQADASSSSCKTGPCPVRKIALQNDHFVIKAETAGPSGHGHGAGPPSKHSAKRCWTLNADDVVDGDSDASVEDSNNNAERLIEKGEERPGVGGATSRSVLGATAFVWLPICRPAPRTNGTAVERDVHFREAHKCIRLQHRRNALADPGQMAMTQETRERIQREVASRKTSMSRKVSQYFKAIVSDSYEVDLI